MQSRNRDRGNRASPGRRRISLEVETACPAVRCGWREHVSASLVTLSNCPLCGTSMRLAPVRDCCGTSSMEPQRMRLSMYACDELGIVGAVALGFRDRQLVLCLDFMNDARASLGRLCERLTVVGNARDGISSMGKQTVVFAFSIEDMVTIQANGLKGTVVGLTADRDEGHWIAVEYVLATGAVASECFKGRFLAAVPAAPETVGAPPEPTDPAGVANEPETAARDARRDEVAPPLEAGHR